MHPFTFHPPFHQRRHMIIVLAAFTVAVTSGSANSPVFKALALVSCAFTFTLALKDALNFHKQFAETCCPLGNEVHFLPILVGIV
jgi:hypothetical protein